MKKRFLTAFIILAVIGSFGLSGCGRDTSGGDYTDPESYNSENTPDSQNPGMIDGRALYADKCAVCHGALAESNKKGAAETDILSAIDNNIGGMGSLSALTGGQLGAIVTALSLTSQTVEPPSDDSGGTPPDAGTCNVMRDSYDGTSNWGYLTIGRHYNDAARITVTGTYTVCKLRLKMYQYNADPGETARQIFDVSIFSHDAVRDAPGRRIGNPSAPMSAGSLVRGETNGLGQPQGNYTAIQDVYFDLNVPVVPGTYWLVFKTHNYNDIVWSHRLRNNVVPDSSNAYPLRGRALSYYAEPAGLGDGGWQEFYTCQVRYALYSN